MKHLFTLFAFSIFIQNVHAQMPVPQCTILSVSHFGGDKSDDIIPVPQLNSNIADSTFRVGIGTLSTTGNINTSCSAGAFFQTYNTDASTVLNESCAPVGTNFQRPSYYVFPQANGDTVIFGQSNDSLGNYGMERRDASGSVLWTKSYGGSTNEGFVSATPTVDNSGFFINGGSLSDDGEVGLHYGDSYNYDIWIVKVDNDGDLLWSKVIGGTYQDGIEYMVAAEDGGVYLFGVTSSDDHDATGNHGEGDLYIVKLDSLGNIQWHHCYGGSGNDGGQHIKALKDGSGGFYVGAGAESAEGDVQHRPAMVYDLWLLHIDSVGNLLWENTFGGPNWEFLYDMCRSTDGSIWMGGISGGGGLGNPVGGDVAYNYGGKDAWVVHADTSGNLINSCTLGNDNNDYLRILQPLPDGNVLAGGIYSSVDSDADPASPGFPKQTYGDDLSDIDIFLAKLSPQTDLGVHEQPSHFEIWELYPNPAKQQVIIHVQNDNRKYQVAIKDTYGREVYKDKFRSRISIPTQSFADGIYLVTLSRKGASDTKKLIIQK